ncbi:hypothetical protein PFAS1_02925 [Pseudomonas frederiksbergensis]|nr:hypothetical protein PFAS1_02925 [Pseudomonas frederiksbergensis]
MKIILIVLLTNPIVPTLCVVTPLWTRCVRSWDAERPWLHSHAEHGNDQNLATPKLLDCNGRTSAS